MIKWILSILFKLSGWKVKGVKPDLKKYVIIVAPHTSNWDFFVGWTGRNVIGFQPNFLAKKELFKIPLVGWFMSYIGGVPVDRKNKKQSTELVQQIVDLYATRDEFIMTIAPEGTRSYAPHWKSGFYRIAVQANVPIFKVGLDYRTKTLSISEPYYPTGNMEVEMEEIKNYFKQFTGKNPENGVK